MEIRETREQAFEAAMHKRHKIAMTGVRLEHMVWGEGGKAGFSEVRAFVKEQHLPESAQEKLLEIIDVFEKRELAFDDMQRQLEEKLGFRIQDDPERVGKLYFETKNEYHAKPEGKVTLTRERGYFKLFFERDEDFDELYLTSDERVLGGAGTGIFELTPNLLDPAYRRRYENRLDRMRGRNFALYTEENVEQLRTEGLELPDEIIFSAEMPLISIKGKAEFQKPLLEHERQHIIYNQFQNNADPFDAIRNELLAQIRGNDWPGAELLDNPSYSKHERDLDVDQRREVRRLLDAVNERLHTLPAIFGEHETRALLTYHLLDLPLEKMPERITSLERFYGPYLKPFAEYQPPTSYENEHVMTVSDIRYGFAEFNESMREYTDRVVATYDAWMDGFHNAVYNALILVGDSHTRSGVDDVRRLRDAAVDALRVLREKSSASQPV